MILLAYVALLAWIPVVLALFSALPPHRAMIASYVAAWLFLPALAIRLPGFPDFDKVTATTVGVLLASLIFDTGRLLSFRFRWYDLPAAVWCVSPVFTSLSNDLGLYDGLSSAERQVVSWGLPYLLGRVYFASPTALRELGLGIVIGGLIYVPLCLYEIRFSPFVHLYVYGFTGFIPWEGTRYGGYRPRVFLETGLELGMWFTLVTLIAYRCWARGVVKSLGGMPFWAVLLVLAANTVLCKATGALLLLVGGLLVLWLARVTRSSWPVWVLALLPLAYVGVRTTGVWSGRQMTDVAKSLFGEDRAQSLQFRFDNEVILVDKALQRPLLGWGGFGRARVYNENGRDLSITDGLWIITLGNNGLIGLGAMLGFFALPIATMLVRHPIAEWAEPELAPAAALAIILGLYSLDNLSNAMQSPIYPLVAGGIAALPAGLPGRGRSPMAAGLEAGDRLAAAGRPHEAASAYRDAIAAAPTIALDAEAFRDLASAHARLADVLEGAGLAAEAEGGRRDALALREMLAESPEALDDDHRELATALEDLARALAGRGNDAEVAALRRRATATWAALAPLSREDYDRWNRSLNDLAWLLATSADAATRDADQAVRLAERAARDAPGLASCWNTLGMALHRAGDDAGAVDALARSIQLGPPGGTAFDLLVLAMARHRLGDARAARDALERGEAWADRHRPDHPVLARLRREARALLAVPLDRRTPAGRG